MPGKVQYYASLKGGATLGKPSGLVRRVVDDHGVETDEVLRRELIWWPTSAVIESEFGGMDLEEITNAEAERLIADFRRQFSADRYYVVVADEREGAEPSGLARRVIYGDGYVEEQVLEPDLSWTDSTVITDWQAGVAAPTLVEIPVDDVGALIERLRQKWAN